MSSELYNLLNEMQHEKNTKLKPENLRQGVKAFGITGTMVAPADNRTVRHYNTGMEMEEEEEPLEGDLALVYNYQFDDIKDSNMYMNFSSLKLKRSFTIDAAITSYITEEFQPDDSTLNTSLNVYGRPTYVEINVNSYNSDSTESLYVNARYDTTDGTTFELSSYSMEKYGAMSVYTTDDIDVPIELQNSVHWSKGTYNANGIVRALSVADNEFSGVFKYETFVDTNSVETLKTFAVEEREGPYGPENYLVGEPGVILPDYELSNIIASPVFSNYNYFFMEKTNWEEEHLEFGGALMQLPVAEEETEPRYIMIGSRVKDSSYDYWSPIYVYLADDGQRYLVVGINKSRLEEETDRTYLFRSYF